MHPFSDVINMRSSISSGLPQMRKMNSGQKSWKRWCFSRHFAIKYGEKHMIFQPFQPFQPSPTEQQRNETHLLTRKIPIVWRNKDAHHWDPYYTRLMQLLSRSQCQLHDWKDWKVREYWGLYSNETSSLWEMHNLRNWEICQTDCLHLKVYYMTGRLESKTVLGASTLMK